MKSEHGSFELDIPIRNSLKYVGSINHKQFATQNEQLVVRKELKAVYQAFTTEEVMFELNELEEK